MSVDWSGCPETEIIEGKVSGMPLVIGTRTPAEAVTINYESAMNQGMSPAEALIETAENYPAAGLNRIKRLLDYYYARQPQHQP